MRSVTAGEAARSFHAILKAAEDGEVVVITRGGKPIAKLVPANGAVDPFKPRLRSAGLKDHS